jgi:hypothetical protein
MVEAVEKQVKKMTFDDLIDNPVRLIFYAIALYHCRCIRRKKKRVRPLWAISIQMTNPLVELVRPLSNPYPQAPSQPHLRPSGRDNKAA